MGQIKRILTLEDLVKFCKKEKFYNFSAQDTGYQLAVQIPSTFEISNDYTDDTLLFCNVKLFHIGENRNHSSVTKDAAIKSLPTIAYKPLLANFCEIDGVRDFTAHDMKIDEDGNVEYLERQIGCFTADTSEIKYDKETDKEFVFAKVAIPREYTDACEIIERKNGTKVSVELLVNEMQYSAENHLLELTDIVVSGAACLGTNPETGEPVEEGMKGARLAIEDFSNKNNSVVDTFAENYQDKMIEVLDKLNTTLSNFNKTNVDEEGGNEEMVDVKNIVVNEEVPATEDVVVENESVEDAEVTVDEAIISEETSSEDGGEVEATAEEQFAENVVETPEDMICSFKLSHEDTRFAIQQLLAASCTEDAFLFVEKVYDKHFIYIKLPEGDAFKQNYKIRKDIVSFVDDPIPVFTEFVTQEERDELEKLRKDYAALVEFKADVDASVLKAKKTEILDKAEYGCLAENAEFAKLRGEIDDYSVEELSTKADLIFAAHMKSTMEFSARDDEAKKHKTIGVNFNKKESKKGPYGNLFNS